MVSYTTLIERLLEGKTPKENYEALQKLISENNRAKGRIDFCKNQFKIIHDGSDEEWTRKNCNAILQTLDTPI